MAIPMAFRMTSSTRRTSSAARSAHINDLPRGCRTKELIYWLCVKVALLYAPCFVVRLLLVQGGNNGSACQGGIVPGGIVPRAPCPLDSRPSAAVVARRAIRKRWMRRKALSAEPAAYGIGGQEITGKRASDSNDRYFSAPCAGSTFLPG